MCAPCLFGRTYRKIVEVVRKIASYQNQPGWGDRKMEVCRGGGGEAHREVHRVEGK